MHQPPDNLPADAADGPLTGQLLDGKYRVGGLLGRGGMSEVYRARHERLGRACAIKVLRPGRTNHPDATARFEREATLASRISHPNVCQVHDSGSTPDGIAWLAMELLAGESLARRLDDGPMSPECVAAITAGCAAGLAAAHAVGVVHRDLKPANVMLVERDGREVPVLLDFGIAWAPEGSALTRDGMMVGTPEVMSPEQIAGDPVGAASDQYQLALLACRMLTGKLPFQASTTQETMVMRLTTPPARLGALLPGVSVGADTQAVLDRGLARRPSDRYPTVAAFGAALEAALRAGPAATEILPRPGGDNAVGHATTTPALLPPGSSGRRWALGKFLIVVVLILAVTRPWEPGVEPVGPTPPAPPPLPPAESVVTPPPAAPSAAVPAPLPGAIPALPSEEAVFSADSTVRRGARQQAEMVYRSGAAPDTVRALAAYFVAEVFRREGLHSTARTWLRLCLDLGERKLCRDLLNALP